MTTTFEKFPASWYQNYCSRPTKDVEIIDPAPLCDVAPFFKDRGKYGEYGPKCHKPIHWDPEAPSPIYGKGAHVHDDGSTEHRPRAVNRCYYCGNNEPGTVHYRQMSYSDETWCDRCGGRHGYPIGD